MDETTYMSEITSARKTLLDNCDSLEEVANFCEDNYTQAENKHVALEETKNYATQSLASVAYQINTMATSMLQMLDVTASRISTIDHGLNTIGLTIGLHDERVTRQAFKTALQCPNDYVRHEKVARPQWATGNKPMVSHVSTPIDYSSLDDVGHGLKLGLNPSPRNSRSYSSSSLHSTGRSPQSLRKQGKSPGGSPRTSWRHSLSPDDYVATANDGATVQKNHTLSHVPPAPPIAPPPPPQIPGKATSDSLQVPGTLSPSNDVCGNVSTTDVDDIPIPPPPFSLQVDNNVPAKAEELPAPPPPPSNHVNNNVLTTKAEDIPPPPPLMSGSEDILHNVGGGDLPPPPKSEPEEVYQNFNAEVKSTSTTPVPDSGGSNQIKPASPRKSPNRNSRSLARPMKKPPPPPPTAPPPPPPTAPPPPPPESNNVPSPPTISISSSNEARKPPSVGQARTEISNPTYSDIPPVPQPPPSPPMPSQNLDHVAIGGGSALPPPPTEPATADELQKRDVSFEDQLKQRLTSRQTEEVPEPAVIAGDPGPQSVTEFVSQEEPEWAPQVYNSKVVAIFDYEALRDDEMTFQEGDIIYITDDFQDGWLMGVHNGVTAMIPGNYVEQMP